MNTFCDITTETKTAEKSKKIIDGLISQLEISPYNQKIQKYLKGGYKVTFDLKHSVEKVIVISDEVELVEIKGQQGVIRGISKDKNGVWNYSVWIYLKELVWSITENGIRSLGNFDTYNSDIIT